MNRVMTSSTTHPQLPVEAEALEDGSSTKDFSE
jgi:hypothetical protein